MASQVNRSAARTLTSYAMLLSAALILSYIEALLPSLGIFKLGLANIAVTLAVYLRSRKCGFSVMVCRVAITSLLYGSVTSFVFSLCGGILAWGVSSVLVSLHKRGTISLIGVSILSAASHNLGQVLAACAVFTSPAPLAMLWWLLLAAIPTGAFTGILSELAKSRIGGRI